MGELNNAMWRKQFAALRDGDRFFYAHDPVLSNPAVNAIHSLRRSETGLRGEGPPPRAAGPRTGLVAP